MATESQIDPESLVARMMAELQANPAARELLLRSALTQEFLGLPARMEALGMEERRAGSEDRLTRLEEAVANIVEAVQHSAADIACLKSMDVEAKLHRSVRSRVSQALRLRRARIMQSELLEPLPELVERMDAALAAGLTTADQDSRVEATDVILRAERNDGREWLWVAIEASSSIHQRDIEQTRESADILALMFEEPAEAAVVGHRISDMDYERADAARVHVLIVPPSL